MDQLKSKFCLYLSLIKEEAPLLLRWAAITRSGLFVFCLPDSFLPPRVNIQIFISIYCNKGDLFTGNCWCYSHSISLTQTNIKSKHLSRGFTSLVHRERNKKEWFPFFIIFKWIDSIKSEGLKAPKFISIPIIVWQTDQNLDLFIQNVNTWTCNTVSIFLLSDTSTNIKMWRVLWLSCSRMVTRVY